MSEPLAVPPATLSVTSMLIGRSLSDDLDYHLARSRAVELNEEDALPDTEQQIAVSERDRLAGAHQQVLAMRVAVEVFVFSEVDRADRQVVVAVVDADRGDPREHRFHVLEQQRLRFVDPDRGRGVAREDDGEPVSHAGSDERTADVLRYVDELGRAGGVV